MYMLSYKLRETFNMWDHMKCLTDIQLTPPLHVSLDTKTSRLVDMQYVTTANIIVSQPSSCSRAVYIDYIWACKWPFLMACPSCRWDRTVSDCTLICPTLFSQTDPPSFLKCPSCDCRPLSFGDRRRWPPSAPRSPESCLTLFSSSWKSLTWRRKRRIFKKN